jgi:hypothetical protein
VSSIGFACSAVVLVLAACSSDDPAISRDDVQTADAAPPPPSADASLATDAASPDAADAADAGPPIPWSCTGSYGTTRAADGDYFITAFGCWKDATGGLHGDSGDNCIPGCLAQAKTAGVCLAGETGKQCEERVTWFTADAGRFGCLAKVKVTNPNTGKSVVAIALDFGPSCKSVEQKVQKAVLDASGRVDRELFGADQGFADHALVHVTEVPDATALGPTP